MLSTYYRLTKPGIIYGNTLTAVAGFLLAAQTNIDIWLLLAALAGTMLIIASGCVFNNYIDRDIDMLMARTKKRATVSGEVSGRNALIFASILCIFGFYVLIAYVNTLTAVIGLIGLIDYAIIYTYAKRHTVHSTLIGSIAGSTALVAGYTAVTGQLDSAVLALFLIMATLQMPHFYAIAIYRIKDYKAAKIPVLPIVRGIRETKIQIIGYIVTFILSCSLLTIFGYTGYIYLAFVLALGAGWLLLAYQGFSTKDDSAWARKVFFYSLIVILSISLMIPLGAWLP